MIRHLKIAAALLLALAMPAAADAVRVIDGDTIVHRGQTIRIMGLDAPEKHHRCLEEKVLAERARARLEELLADGFRVEAHGHDRYGRVRAVVFDARGMNVANVLIVEGLARRYNGRGPRELWC
ncbi:MAG: thermonuclease family protein [Roseomonas sp.]|nr:thermonuclease family protein [Roseomonas sp.]